MANAWHFASPKLLSCTWQTSPKSSLHKLHNTSVATILDTPSTPLSSLSITHLHRAMGQVPRRGPKLFELKRRRVWHPNQHFPIPTWHMQKRQDWLWFLGRHLRSVDSFCLWQHANQRVFRGCLGKMLLLLTGFTSVLKPQNFHVWNLQKCGVLSPGSSRGAILGTNRGMKGWKCRGEWSKMYNKPGEI